MIDWDTQLQTDPMFAAWVQAQIGKAGVDCAAYRAECEKWRETAQAQARRLAEAEQQLGVNGKRPRKAKHDAQY